jgi:hypothetical protein
MLMLVSAASSKISRPSPPSPVLPDAQAIKLQQDLSSAIAAGMPSFAIAGGDYHFNGVDFEIFEARGFVITSPQPVNFWFAPGFGIHFRDCQKVGLGNWSIDYNPPWKTRTEGITYQLTNCSDVVTEDLTIFSAPSMAITAFNGGGGHVFRRIKTKFSQHPGASTTHVVSRDAMHFSDLRRGPIIEDSVIGYSGDDFFNVHGSLFLLLKCETPSTCIVINPFLPGGGVPNIRPLYGGSSPMSTVRPNDHMAFYAWPAEDMVYHDLVDNGDTLEGRERPSGFAEIRSLVEVNDSALLAEAAALSQELTNWSGHPWTAWTNLTFGFMNTNSTLLWRVEFTAPLPAHVVTAMSGPRNTSGPVIITVNEISSANAQLRNNVFTHTDCNLGRFKSPGGAMVGNTFSNASLKNLELTALLQFFEGPVRLGGIEVRDNSFDGVGSDPVHCGPLCEAHVIRGGQLVQCMDIMTGAMPCPACPDCSSPTPWASATLRNNTVRP